MGPTFVNSRSAEAKPENQNSAASYKLETKEYPILLKSIDGECTSEITAYWRLPKAWPVIFRTARATIAPLSAVSKPEIKAKLL